MTFCGQGMKMGCLHGFSVFLGSDGRHHGEFVTIDFGHVRNHTFTLGRGDSSDRGYGN